jgi:hypothetical protein
MRIRPTLLALAFLATPAVTRAQATPAHPVAPAARPPAAKPEDVASVDAIIAALYAVISGPPGQARDWDRMRSLFHPAARMEPIVPRREGGGFEVRVLAPDDYVQRSGEMLTRHGFTEKEIARRQERFGNLVHVWSTYEGRFTGEAAPTKEPIRGINSIQLAWDGTRWWILNLAWDSERPGSALPPEYLPR